MAVADAIGSVLDSSVPILVEVQWSPLSCTPTSGLLGQAGPNDYDLDFPNAPRSNTWYPVALASSLAGEDRSPGEADIFSQFNSAVDDDPGCLGGDGFWYGIDSPAPPGQSPLANTVLHEFIHGLGFITLVDRETGEKALGRDDIFSISLEDHSLGMNWPQMTDQQRAASALDTGDLHWVGQNVVNSSTALSNGAHPSGHVEMHAPGELELGSSVSHWAEDVTPDEIMEAAATPNPQNLVTNPLLEDLGWGVTVGEIEPCVGSEEVLCLNGGRFKVEVTWRDFKDQVGTGKAVPFTNDSGLYWFFSPDNFEMLIKVLTGCGFNNRFWVFFAATTNVEFQVKVTDSETGVVKRYTNPLSQPANAVTDTSAFATCPASITTATDAYTNLGITSIDKEVAARVQRELAEAQALAIRPTLTALPAGRRLATPGLAVLSASDALDVRPVDTTSPRLVPRQGPSGSRYEVTPFLTDGSTIYTIQGSGNGNVVTFDNKRENLKSYEPLSLNTIPRMEETVASLGANLARGAPFETLRLELTMDTKNGDELFPGGFIGEDEVALDSGGFALGFLQGTNPLDFDNEGVTAATFTLHRPQGSTLNFVIPEPDLPTFFGQGSWSGDLAVVFPDIVNRGSGRGISGGFNRMVATIDVLVEGEEPPPDPDPPDPDPPGDPFECVPNATTMCLNNDRFEVTVVWEDFRGNVGPGMKTDIPGIGDVGPVLLLSALQSRDADQGAHRLWLQQSLLGILRGDDQRAVRFDGSRFLDRFLEDLPQPAAANRECHHGHRSLRHLSIDEAPEIGASPFPFGFSRVATRRECSPGRVAHHRFGSVQISKL